MFLTDWNKLDRVTFPFAVMSNDHLLQKSQVYRFNLKLVYLQQVQNISWDKVHLKLVYLQQIQDVGWDKVHLELVQNLRKSMIEF